MNVYMLFAACVALCALTWRLASIRRTRLKAALSTPVKAVSQVRQIAGLSLQRSVLESLRDAAFVSAMALLLLIIAVTIAEVYGRTTRDFSVTMAAINAIRKAVFDVRGWIAVFALSISSVTLFVVSRKCARELGKHLSPELFAQLKADQESEVARITHSMSETQRDPAAFDESNDWQSAQQNTHVAARRQEVDAAWTAFHDAILPQNTNAQTRIPQPWSDDAISGAITFMISSLLPEADSISDDEILDRVRSHPSANAAMEAAATYVRALYEYREAIARSYVRLVNDPTRSSISDPESIAEFVESVAESKSLRKSLRGASRFAYLASIAIFAISVIGLTGKQATLDSMLRVANLVVSGQAKAAANAESDLSSESTVLSDEDRQVVRLVARHWEEQFFSKFSPPPVDPSPQSWTPRADPSSPDSPQNLTPAYEIKSTAVRESILHEAVDARNSMASNDPSGERTKRRYETVSKRGIDGSSYWFGSGGDDPPGGSGTSGGRPDDLDSGGLKGPFGGRPSPTTGPTDGSGATFEFGTSGASAADDLSRRTTQTDALRRAAALLNAYEMPLASDGPITDVGLAFEKELVRLCKRSPSVLARCYEALQAPLYSDYSAAVFGRALDLLGGPGTDVEMAARSYIGIGEQDSQVVKVQIRMAAAAAKAEMSKHLSAGAGILDAISESTGSIGKSTFIDFSTYRSVYDRIIVPSPRDPAVQGTLHVIRLDRPSMIAQTEDIALRGQLQSIKEVIDLRLSTEPASVAETRGSDGIVTQFDDIAAPRATAEPDTYLGRRTAQLLDQQQPVRQTPTARPSYLEEALSLLGSSGGGGQITPSSGAVRARSFTVMRGFSRVGGVVIGQKPELDEYEQINDIEWSLDKSGDLYITLVAADGSSAMTLPIDADLALQALRYAADGRVLTATMISNALPIAIESKVLAVAINENPVFKQMAEALTVEQDTARAIRLKERLIDLVYSKRADFNRRHGLPDAQPELKALLHPSLVDKAIGNDILNLDRFVDSATSTDLFPDSEVAEKRESLQMKLRYQNACYEVAFEYVCGKEGARRRLIDVFNAQQDRVSAALEGVSDAGLSPLAARDDLFDRGILEALEAFSDGGATDIDHLIAQLDAVKGNLRVTDLNSIEVWSGVRESPFRVSLRDLVENGQPTEDSLQFVFQAAYVTADSSDQEPWLPLELNNDIPGAVAMMLSYNGWSAPWSTEMKRLFDVMQREFGLALPRCIQFTRLQRMFRCAFDGWFGPSFPVEKLSILHRALMRFEKRPIETPRWNNCTNSQARAWIEFLSLTNP